MLIFILGGVIVGLIVGYLLTFIYELMYTMILVKTKKQPIFRIFGWHVHHSNIGLIMLVMFILELHPFFLGSGAGVILRHTHFENRLTFIDKN